MERDPLEIPGENGLGCDSDSDIEILDDRNALELQCDVIKEDNDATLPEYADYTFVSGSENDSASEYDDGDTEEESEVEIEEESDESSGSDGPKVNNDKIALTVELVPADNNYVQKLTAPTTSSTATKVKKKKKRKGDEISQVKENQYVELRPPGRPKKYKKKKPQENIYKPVRAKSQMSREKRYALLQEKKEESFQSARWLKMEAAKEKQKKYQSKYKTEPKPAPRPSMNIPKKVQTKIKILITKILKHDASKTREALTEELENDFLTDRKKFWEKYKELNKTFFLSTPRKLTNEKMQLFAKLKQDQILMVNRVSTRNNNKNNSSTNSMISQDEQDLNSLSDFHVENELIEEFDDNISNNMADFFSQPEENDQKIFDEDITDQQFDYDTLLLQDNLDDNYI